MAITFDNSSQTSGAAVTSVTYSHTVGSGSDRILFVGVMYGNGITSGAAATYNGVSMTLLNSINAGGTVFNVCALFYLVNPPTGAHNIVVSAGQAGYIFTGSTSYFGVDQTTPLDVNTTNSNNGTTITGTLTTTVDNDWLIGLVSCVSTFGQVTAGSNTTVRVLIDVSVWGAMVDTNAGQTPAGSHSLNATVNSGQTAINLVAIRPVASTVNKGAFFLAV